MVFYLKKPVPLLYGTKLIRGETVSQRTLEKSNIEYHSKRGSINLLQNGIGQAEILFLDLEALAML